MGAPWSPIKRLPPPTMAPAPPTRSLFSRETEVGDRSHGTTARILETRHFPRGSLNDEQQSGDPV